MTSGPYRDVSTRYSEEHPRKKEMNWFHDFGHALVDTMKELFELVESQYQDKALNIQSETKIYSGKEMEERDH